MASNNVALASDELIVLTGDTHANTNCDDEDGRRIQYSYNTGVDNNTREAIAGASKRGTAVTNIKRRRATTSDYERRRAITSDYERLRAITSDISEDVDTRKRKYAPTRRALPDRSGRAHIAPNVHVTPDRRRAGRWKTQEGSARAAGATAGGILTAPLRRRDFRGRRRARKLGSWRRRRCGTTRRVSGERSSRHGNAPQSRSIA